LPELLLVAALCCAVVTATLFRMLRPPRRGEAVIRSLAALVLAAAVVVVLGRVTGAETLPFLLATAFAAAPVAVLLGGAAEEAAPGERAVAWTLVLLWAGVVFPLATIVPPLVFASCGEPECRVEDFGGGLALLVSSSAAVLLAWRAPNSGAREGWARFALPTTIVWIAGAVWLATLEGVLDSYTPRILFAAFVAPLGGAVGWLFVDLLRRAPRHPLRSIADGVIAGFVAIIPGAAGISFPWSLAVGALAGAAAALVYGSRRLATGGRAGHWAHVVLMSTAVGYLAPAVSGDTIGFVFSGRITALLPPVAAFVAVGLLGLVASIPAWAMLRRAK
jgi:ammonia channel protein AmtB